MTLTEFSNQFDILYNNISSNSAPGLTEYEKSVFLTQAQDEIILELYRGGIGAYESSEEVSRYINTLVVTKNIITFEEEDLGNIKEYTVNEEEFSLSDILFIVRESAIYNDKFALVSPTTNNELNIIINNPFRGPSDRKILRLYHSNTIKLYGPLLGDLYEYTIHYIPKLDPIILTDLDYDLTIGGLNIETPCSVPECLHNLILNRAVQLATVSWANKK